jgi:N-acetylmuramic acid 6-phosphate etherase
MSAMDFLKTTELPSTYRNLESTPTETLLTYINEEDSKVSSVIKALIPVISNFIDLTAERIKAGGRMFYIGAGTSGRLGVLDASECPPTFGVSADVVIGIMAGGDDALRTGIEDAEDDPLQGWKDLEAFNANAKDVVVGIAASGTTPYVLGALKEARNAGLLTACIVCNANSPISEHADFPIEAVVGPEFITGSTRMKAGTAQKMILNMISTGVMIRFGRVLDNRMVNMQITNSKLVDRGIKMLMEKGNLTDYEEAKSYLLDSGSVQEALSVLAKKSK